MYSFQFIITQFFLINYDIFPLTDIKQFYDTENRGRAEIKLTTPHHYRFNKRYKKRNNKQFGHSTLIFSVFLHSQTNIKWNKLISYNNHPDIERMGKGVSLVYFSSTTTGFCVKFQIGNKRHNVCTQWWHTSTINILILILPPKFITKQSNNNKIHSSLTIA